MAFSDAAAGYVPVKRSVVLLVIALSACGRTRQAGPPTPYDEAGACPFQCCTYREWSVDWDTDLHTDRKDDSPIAFHVALGDTVTALTGVVTTTNVGRATANRQVSVGNKHITVAAGEPIYLLRNVGSDWKIWVNGITDEQYIPNQGYCTGNKQSSDECALKVVEQPHIVWWAKVRNALGQEGWTREVDHFGNIDSCG
ncbi:MAG TPA: hypothetical protein VL693_17880 [Vicinamibacterales bacterium]|jgi:hypothetical protein|nr:hypothetical protein [Vicinamibacterales bacterium]